MIDMKTILIFYALLFTTTITVSAQGSGNTAKKTSFFGGAQVSIAAGDLAPTHKWGIGIHTQVLHKIDNKNALTGKVNYTYLFGKKYTYRFYEPGSSTDHETMKYKGMNSVNISGGVRHNITDNWFGGLDGGLCLGFSEGHSATSLQGELEFGYYFDEGDNPFLQALAAWFNICGDPKLQFGIRYSIGL
jgi:hypothetical protein